MSECNHENSISCYDTTCHVLLGQWYCTDCKKVWHTKEKEGIIK